MSATDMTAIIRSTEYKDRLTNPVEKSRELHLLITKLETLLVSIPSLIEKYKQELTDLIAKTHFNLSQQLQETTPDTRDYRTITNDMKQLEGYFDNPTVRRGSMNSTADPVLTISEQKDWDQMNPYTAQDPEKSGGYRQSRQSRQSRRRKTRR